MSECLEACTVSSAHLACVVFSFIAIEMPIPEFERIVSGNWESG